MFASLNPAFDTYCAPARAYPQIWRLIAGLITAGLIYLAFVLAVVFLPARSGVFIDAALGGNGTPLETSLVLLSFGGMGGGVVLAARLFQKRGFPSLLGPDPRAILRSFFVTFAIVGGLLAVWMGVGMMARAPVPNLLARTWLAWLPSSLVLLLVQTGSEELVFRGYLQQQLAARYSSRWVWWVLPALLFGLAHFDGESTGVNAWLVVADTFLIGLIAGDLTARTGNLGAAVGLHLANNTAALLVMATEGTITGLSLFVTPFAITDARAMRSMLLADLVVALVLYTMYLFIMALRQRRRLQSSERNLI